MQEMTIGELASRCGTTPKTLRYYERIGLVPPPRRGPSGYRLYGSAHLERIDFIRKAKRLALSLDEIKTILAIADSGGAPCGHVVATLDAHIERTDRAIAELRRFRDQLKRIRSTPAHGPASVCPIVERGARAVEPPSLIPLTFAAARRDEPR